MADIILTIPKSFGWERFKQELSVIKSGTYIKSFKVAHLPKTEIGERCYILYNGLIRGYLIIEGFDTTGFTCTTTGKYWKSGNFINVSGEFTTIDPIPMKGFQGFRYFSRIESNNEN